MTDGHPAQNLTGQISTTVEPANLTFRPTLVRQSDPWWACWLIYCFEFFGGSIAGVGFGLLKVSIGSELGWILAVAGLLIFSLSKTIERKVL